MSKDLNKVMITGRLGKDAEMRFTPQGSAVTTFSVACNRSYKTADGQTHDDTEWFSVVAWNKLAEICNQYLSKGSRVYIEGRLQTRSWDDQNTGEKRYKTELIASDVIMLDDRRGAGGAHTAGPDPEEAEDEEELDWNPQQREPAAPAAAALAPKKNLSAARSGGGRR